MKFQFVYPSRADDATNRYRCVHLCEALTAAGHSASHASASTANVVVDADILILHRMRSGGAGARFRDAARAIGAAVVYSADDLVFDPEYAIHTGLLFPSDPLRYRHSKLEAEANRASLASADGALVSTQFLAEAARHLIAPRPVCVVRNFPGAELIGLSGDAARRRQAWRRDDDRVMLGYLAGSPTHDGDLADIAQPLAEAMTRHPNSRLLLVGTIQLPGVLEPLNAAGRIRRHPFVPWRELPNLLASIDINLAPLDTTRPFNHAKSEIKFLEAAAVGVPTVAAAARGFAEGIRVDQGCILVRDHADWCPTLCDLLERRDRRDALAQNAAAFAARQPGLVALGEGVAAALEVCCPSQRSRVAPVTVRQPQRDRWYGAALAAEARLFRRWHWWRRHFRLISVQERPGGGSE